MQLLYFTGYANWNYFTAPFLLTQCGVNVREIEPYEEHGETWQRLQVQFPSTIPTHSSKRKPNSARVSLTFKDVSVRKVNRLRPNVQESFNFEDDLHFIENALADEFSLLFYIGLLRDNDHKASGYPLTTAFLRPSSNIVYPKWSLMSIAKSDDEIRNKLTEWINETLEYQRLALDKLNEICVQLKNG
jgi:hypothetical protein